jgi:hypothetical protein
MSDIFNIPTLSVPKQFLPRSRNSTAKIKVSQKITQTGAIVPVTIGDRTVFFIRFTSKNSTRKQTFKSKRTRS